jgi:arabinofuranosyltransferase
MIRYDVIVLTSLLKPAARPVPPSMTGIALPRTGDSVDIRRLVTLAASVAFAVLFVRTAWLNDDAYITFRTVDNFLNGFGLRWNVANRVQAYTHPLWMFVVSGAVGLTGEVYYTSILLSIAISTAAVVLIASRIASSLPTALFALSALALSKAFIDYSTSGLENPLTHLLLVVFFTIAAAAISDKRRLLSLSLVTALVMVNRLDAGLLVLPALAVTAWRAGWRRAVPAVLFGMLPLLAWEAFSLIYYGFPFPNTAYSKLATGIPRGELLHQGFLYLLDSLSNDPVTVVVIGAAILSSFVLRSNWTIPTGIVLYVAYVIWAGGDFMSGRFFAAPLLCAVIHLARYDVAAVTAPWVLAMTLVWGIGLSAPRPTVFSTAAYGSDIEPARVIAATGITDERRFYYPQSGLLNAHRGVPMPNHKWVYMGDELRMKGERLFSTDAAGFIGYAAGPGVHFIDRYGLGDALLARLPAEAPWRVGHYVRRVPDGYRESLESGRNLIRDPGVAAFYERIRLITEGPIWNRDRVRAIVRMNLGTYDRLIEAYGLVRVPLSALSTVKADGTDWNLPGNTVMTLRGVEVSLPDSKRARSIELTVSRNDHYRVVLLTKGVEAHEQHITQRMSGDSSLITKTVSVPPDLEFDTILVTPSAGDARYSLGHIRIVS